MALINNRFWRLEPTRGMDPVSVLQSRILAAPMELIRRVKLRDGIVLGTWNPDTEQGEVHALGLVGENDGHTVSIDWRPVKLTLRPTGPGATQWRTRPFFKFNDLVATRYGLMASFVEVFASDKIESTRPRNSAADSISANTRNPERLRDDRSADPRPMIPRIRGPQRNRVAPNGEVFATAARGMFMGNRTSPPRWLICDLHFKRDLKEPRKYTKLFFLDEAVALAAGHRPCNTCRRDRLQTYLKAVRSELDVRDASELDRLLNLARSGISKRSAVAALPDGAFFVIGNDDYRLKWSGALYRWTPEGYVTPATAAQLQVDEVTVLTPRPSLSALRNGYRPETHPSAAQFGREFP